MPGWCSAERGALYPRKAGLCLTVSERPMGQQEQVRAMPRNEATLRSPSLEMSGTCRAAPRPACRRSVSSSSRPTPATRSQAGCRDSARAFDGEHPILERVCSSARCCAGHQAPSPGCSEATRCAHVVRRRSFDRARTGNEGAHRRHPRLPTARPLSRGRSAALTRRACRHPPAPALAPRRQTRRC